MNEQRATTGCARNPRRVPLWRRRLAWAMRRPFERLCLRVHQAIYYSPRLAVPGVIENRWLAGLSGFCWTFVCGSGVRFSLLIGNIEWNLPFLPRSNHDR